MLGQSLFDVGGVTAPVSNQPTKQETKSGRGKGRDKNRYAPSDGNITANRHKGHVRSLEAYQKGKDTLTMRCQQVLDFFRERQGYGAISDEVFRFLKLPVQSISARMSELKAAGLIVETELIRLTRWNNRATVCVVPEFQALANKAAALEGGAQ
jgi:hypothetical protein